MQTVSGPQPRQVRRHAARLYVKSDIYVRRYGDTAMSNEFDFNSALKIETVYDPSDRFLEAFYTFAGRVASLQRYYEFGGEFISRYLAQTRRSRMQVSGTEDWVAESVHEEMTLQDMDNIARYHHAAVLAHLFSLAEGLFVGVAMDVAQMIGISMELPAKPMPYLNRYVFFLQRTCGLDIQIATSTWKTIDALRAVRNRYVHQLSSDLPPSVTTVLEEIASSSEHEGCTVDHAFVREAFKTIGALALVLDRAYWTFYESRSRCEPGA